MPNFIYIETYGCSANQNNSEIISGLIRQAGLELTNNPEIADILILNTCIVKEPTEKEMERRIKELSKLHKPLIITGCMPDVRKEKLKDLYLLSNKNIKQITNLIKSIQNRDYREQKFLFKQDEIKLCLPKISQNKIIGITQISEGCLGECSYCITRFAKGKLYSYPEEKILENIQRDLKSGCREIRITSQDNASYGLDKNQHNLPTLLKNILKIKGNFRLRLGMMNPNNILPILKELIECYKDEKMFKFLHIPVQSGSNKVLKDMNRKYLKEDFLKIINTFKKEIPNISIATDIIVAYPSETEQDYQESLNLLKEIKPDMLNLSSFWAMKGTPAYPLSLLSRETAKKRTAEIMSLFRQIADENNKKRIGSVFSCLVYDYFKNNFLAHADNYKLVLLKSQKNILGKIVKVKIIRHEQIHLVGEII